MEDYVFDHLVAGGEDVVLDMMIDLVVEASKSGRPLYRTPLEEPRLFRMFRTWVFDGIEARKKLSSKQTELMKKAAPWSRTG